MAKRDMDPSAALARGRKAKAKAAEKEPEPEEVPPIHTFHVDVTDARGQHYRGKFTYKVPTMGDQIEIGAVKTGYLPMGCAADPQALMIAEMIAYCFVCLTETPDWWQPHMFYDATPLDAVYRRCRDYEDRFHGRDAVRGAGHRGAQQEGEADWAGADEGGDGDVGGDVRSPTQRREVLAGDGS